MPVIITGCNHVVTFFAYNNTEYRYLIIYSAAKERLNVLLRKESKAGGQLTHADIGV